jgi:2-polyprenyl-3-methyl-5-hydroxy-6-metoxy-1,4-benzoquinol methylase
VNANVSQFDELAMLYEDMALLPWRRDLEIPTVLGLLGDLSGHSVLDLGCGSGLYCRELAQHGARRVVGLRSRSICGSAHMRSP